MFKKVSLVLASMAVVAFALPALASGNARVTDPPGTLLVAGSTLQLTNIGTVDIQTSLGTITCGTVDFTSELTHNTGTTYRVIGIGVGTTGNCFIGPKRITVTDVTLKELHSATTGKGTINITIVANLPGGVICHFESPNLPYTYTSSTDVIKVSKGDFNAVPPACEPGLITGEFTVETHGGGGVILD